MEPQAIHDKLVAQFGDKIVSADLEAASPFVVVATDSIADVAAFCKEEAELVFDNLMCLSGVDIPGEDPPRMEVVYHILSYTHHHTYQYPHAYQHTDQYPHTHLHLYQRDPLRP